MAAQERLSIHINALTAMLNAVVHRYLTTSDKNNVKGIESITQNFINDLIAEPENILPLFFTLEMITDIDEEEHKPKPIEFSVHQKGLKTYSDKNAENFDADKTLIFFEEHTTFAMSIISALKEAHDNGIKIHKVKITAKTIDETTV